MEIFHLLLFLGNVFREVVQFFNVKSEGPGLFFVESFYINSLYLLIRSLFRFFISS